MTYNIVLPHFEFILQFMENGGYAFCLHSMKIANVERVKNIDVQANHDMIYRVESGNDRCILGKRQVCRGDEESEARDFAYGLVDRNGLPVQYGSAL